MPLLLPVEFREVDGKNVENKAFLGFVSQKSTRSISSCYQSQMPVIEKAIETAALMLGSDRSRGYCLEMICADFLARVNLDNGDPDVLLRALTSSVKFLS